MSAIKTVLLTKKFGDFVANDNINLSVSRGEIHCIVGENGAGKSTLMNMLYGLLAPTEGKIFIHENEVVLRNPLDAMYNGVGMVHQHFKLVPSLKVYENIFLGIEINRKIGNKKPLTIPIVNEKLEKVKVHALMKQYGFNINITDTVDNLSVGEKQKVEILKMLYRNVDILILDEPTAVLAPQEVDELIIQLKNLKQQDKTIIVITHKLQEVLKMSDTITVMKNGKVTLEITTKDADENKLAQAMIGKEIVFNHKKSKAHKITNDKVIYKIQNLSTINSKKQKVVDNVSFQIHEGEILGIAGIEGNGQSELIQLLTGLMIATKGTISFKARTITHLLPHEIRKIGIGIIPEDRFEQGLYKTMSIAANCIAGYHDKREVCRCGLLRKKNIDDKKIQFIDKFDIRISNTDGNIENLSGGNAQKIILAREFEEEPSLLIACQPTRGVDIGSVEFIHKKILNFRDNGKSVLLVSSELSEIMTLSDRILVMFNGKIISEVNPDHEKLSDIGLLMAGGRAYSPSSNRR